MNVQQASQLYTIRAYDIIDQLVRGGMIRATVRLNTDDFVTEEAGTEVDRAVRDGFVFDVEATLIRVESLLVEKLSTNRNTARIIVGYARKALEKGLIS